MRLVPRSLFGRLLGIAALTTLAALAFAAVTIGHVLERFVIRGLDEQLDAQIGILAKAVQPDATLDRSRVVDLPQFDRAGSGWSWRVEAPDGRRWNQGAADDLVAPPRPSGPEPPGLPPPPPAGPGGERRAGPRPGEARDVSGQPLHFRQLTVETAHGPVLVMAAGPRRVALRPLREAMVPLLGSLALLGVALGLATLAQLRLGLRPLRRLQDALADVRAGRARHVPEDQPVELAPLAAELNALIDQNETGLAQARRHVANLAHGLKTPLAALAIKLEESGRDPDGRMTALVTQIDGRVRHHLGRARAAASGAPQRARTPLATAVADLDGALRRIHADRAVQAAIDIPADLAVAVDPQDLDEMVGNLLDNAWRHARSAIRVGASRAEASVILSVDDDGPGVPEEALAEALLPGRRLDERGDGHGFGLSISRELAELNGGQLRLQPSPILSGLRAQLILPANG